MKQKHQWITVALVNLSIVGLLGFLLRTKYLFPLPFIDYKNLLSAHSHFAFGGWVTLCVMTLLVDTVLVPARRDKKIYQWILWGIALTSFGMLLSFPFQGYGPVSIVASTLFIFFTYAFTWAFLSDLRKTPAIKPVRWLVTAALLSLVVSSVGPFTLAYIMATHSGNAFLFRDAVYTFLHFQYNGFFTLSVFALLLSGVRHAADPARVKRMQVFTVFLSLSIIPSLFLSLLWHSYNPYIRAAALLGCALNILTIIFFLRLIWNGRFLLFDHPIARTLLIFALVSFVIKMLLQTGTTIPSLGNAVFGFRPIIIGFLHLVFLGLVTFYMLAHLIERGIFSMEKAFARFAIGFFCAAIIINEGILLADGIGLMLSTAYPVYGTLLWIASILLLTGALMILAARLQRNRRSDYKNET